MMDEHVRIIGYLGAAVIVGGLIYWFATPGDVILGPALVVGVGMLIAGGSHLLEKSREQRRLDDFSSRLHEKPDDTPE